MTKNSSKPNYLLSSYHFEVPEELVAQDPQSKRDESKLLERKACGSTKHQSFYSLAESLPEGSLLILNETKVFSCRLLTKTKTGGKLEVFLLEDPLTKESSTLKALVRPSKKIKAEQTLNFSHGVQAEVLKIEQEQNTRIATLEFNLPYQDLFQWISDVGSIPLPPYIKRSDRSKHDTDLQRYQTVYAGTVGSVAAPTAGLHFTDALMGKLKEKNITVASITLHVGLGTFLPIKVEDITEHTMHEETYRVPQLTLDQIEEKEKEGKKIILVGTTTLRCLESFFLKAKEKNLPTEKLSNTWLKTKLFLHPKEDNTPYKIQKGDALITNFHQPGSSLFILVSALIGRQEALKLYEEAVKENYRFFSYGDSSLLWL